MTKKEIETKFYLIKHEGKSYNAYYKDISGITSVFKYAGVFTISGSSCIFNNEKYKDIDSLYNAVEEYNNSLEYPSDFYDPTIRNVINESRRLDYYIKSLGFEKKDTSYHGNNIYVLYNIKDLFNKTNIDFTVKYDDSLDSLTGDISSNASLTKI